MLKVYCSYPRLAGFCSMSFTHAGNVFYGRTPTPPKNTGGDGSFKLLCGFLSAPKVTRAFHYLVRQMFRGGDTVEDVERVAKQDAGVIDYLGVEFFSRVFLGLYYDAHGNEVRSCRRPLLVAK